MKRCDNCGWYNHDSSEKCEKCGEPLPEFAEPEQPKSPEEPAAQGFTPAHPMAETEPKPTPAERRRKSNASYSATIMDAGAVLAAAQQKEEQGECPKCHYPIAGNPQTCPNCGAPLKPQPQPAPQNRMMSTVRDGSPQASAAKAAAPAANSKATIRDIPKNLRDSSLEPAPAPAPTVAESMVDVTFRLVPVSDPNAPVVYMRVGDLVTIEGKLYRIVQ